MKGFKKYFLFYFILTQFFEVSAQISPKEELMLEFFKKQSAPTNKINETAEYLSSKKKIESYLSELNSRKTNFSNNDNSILDSCSNASFEIGDYSNWYRFDGGCSQGTNAPSGYYPMSGYTPPGNSFVFYNSPIGGPTFTLESLSPTNNISGAGYDPYCKNGVYTLPLKNALGGNYACRINNNTHGSKAIKAEYVFVVPISHPYFVYRYACVMTDGGSSHTTGEQAGIRIKAMYMSGVSLPIANATYETNVNFAISDPTFTKSTLYDNNGSPGSGGEPVYYKKWTTDTLFLCAFVGQSIRVSFEALDCSQGAHFAYMYIDPACNYGPPLNNSIVQNVFCPDSTNFTLTAPAGFPIYQWYDANGVAISSAQTGNLQVLDLNAYVNNCLSGSCSLYDGETFSVSVISPGGCAQKVYTVLHIIAVKLNSYTSTPTCFPAANGSLAVVVSGGLGSLTYNYNWHANNCTGATIGTSSSLLGLPAGNYCVNVTSGGCPPLDTILKVELLPVIALNITESLPPCLDSIAFIHAPPNNILYTWYQNGVLILNESNDSLKINPVNLPSIYQVTFINASGCLDSLIIKPTMNVPPVNLATFFSTPTCKEGSNGALSINVNGGLGLGTYNFSWFNGTCAGALIGNTNSISNLFSGNYCVHVTSGFCPPLDTILHIGVIPMLPVYQTQSLPACLDSIAFIYAEPNNTNYSWYQNSSLQQFQNTDSLQINPLDLNSIYQVTYLDNLGCLDSLVISTDQHLFASEILAVYCPKDSVARIYIPNGNTISQIQWFYSGIPIADSLGGTNDSLSIFIFVNQLNVPLVFINDTLQGYYATYYLNGCKKLADSPIEIFPLLVFIPDTTVNTFTPNYDDINDIFYPYKTLDYSGKQIEMQTDNFELSVFNRWGVLVFHSENYTLGWNGRNNRSEPMSDGTYFWIASFKSNCNSKEKIIEKGFVNLAR